ncbi:MAG: transposase [Planctomycetes bacterium]|nr:transposase [Planctomycetota bacterium]
MNGYENNSQRVDDRIVSISQPHVRPIVRGKAGRPTEFGAKLLIRVVGGFLFVDRRSLDNYNEGTDLIEQIETFRRRFGCYHESVYVDKIYRTRENRAFCKLHGIRISGPPLGRRIFRMTTQALHVSATDKKQAAADEAIRNHVEGKFGQTKRRFSLGRIRTKLASTWAAQISLSFLGMNLERALRQLFLVILFSVMLAAGSFSPNAAPVDRDFSVYGCIVDTGPCRAQRRKLGTHVAK